MNYLQDYATLRTNRVYKDIIVYTCDFERVYKDNVIREDSHYTLQPIIGEYVQSFKSLAALSDCYNLNSDNLSHSLKKQQEKSPEKLFIFKKHYKGYLKPFYYIIVAETFTLDDLL